MISNIIITVIQISTGMLMLFVLLTAWEGKGFSVPAGNLIIPLWILLAELVVFITGTAIPYLKGRSNGISSLKSTISHNSEKVLLGSFSFKRNRSIITSNIRIPPDKLVFNSIIFTPLYLVCHIF